MIDFEKAGLKFDFIAPSETNACATEDSIIRMTISGFKIDI